MNILCITGAPAPALQHVDGLLQRAGMARPQGLERQAPLEPLDLAGWHRQVLARGRFPASGQLGRLWDQMAAALFMANIDAPLWGWSDERSTELLQYWADFEPGVRFVLLCETPQQALARMIDTPRADVGIAATLQAWQAAHQAMLRFNLRNPQRSVLLWASDALQHPAALLEHLQAQWELPLDATALPAEPVPAPDALAQYLAQRLAGQYPELQPLLQELEASVTPLPQDAAPTAAADADPQDLVDAYRALADRSREQQALDRLKALQDTELQPLRQALALRTLELEQALARHDELAGSLSVASQALQEAREHALAQAGQAETLARQLSLACAGREEMAHARQRAEAQLDQARQETELLALQLRQAQEELEASFRQHGVDNQRMAELQQRLSAAEQGLAQAQARQAVETHGREQAQAELREAREEAELLVLQLRQAQEELEANFHRYAAADQRTAELQQRLSAAEQGLAQACAQRDAERQALAQTQDQRDALAAQAAANEALAAQTQQLQAALAAATQALEQAQARQAAETRSREQAQVELQDSREEAELLQLQLRQVQEELESYFQKHMEGQEQLKAAQARMQRLQQRLPGYCDFEALEALPRREDRPQEARWRVRGLEVGGRHIQQLDFFTVQHQGMAGIGLKRGEAEGSPLMRWPAGLNGDRLVLLPLGTAAQLKNQMAALMEVSTSDWELLRALPKLLLAQPGQPYAGWSAALQEHLKQMDKWPAALRFDTLQLVREQTNPDYEHLWLRLGNVSLGAQRWPHLEFRLACANTQGGRFGQQPKLEFPMAARAVFKGWFEESSDDFGAKLELRFAMPNSMDRGIWARLPAADQQLITALLAVLPRVVGLLPAAGMRTRRAVEQWQAVATDMLRVLRQLTAPARPAPAAQPAPAAVAAAPVQAAQAAPAAPAAARIAPVAPPAVNAPAAKAAPAARKKSAGRAKALAKEAQA